MGAEHLSTRQRRELSISQHQSRELNATQHRSESYFFPGCAPLRPGRTYNPHPGIRCVRTVGSLPWGPRRRVEHARYLAQRSVLLEETGNSPPPPSLFGFSAFRRPAALLLEFRKTGSDVQRNVITGVRLPAEPRFPPTPRGNRLESDSTRCVSSGTTFRSRFRYRVG